MSSDKSGNEDNQVGNRSKQTNNTVKETGSEKNPTRSFKKTWYNCQEEGHFAQDCPPKKTLKNVQVKIQQIL